MGEQKLGNVPFKMYQRAAATWLAKGRKFLILARQLAYDLHQKDIEQHKLS